MTKKNFKGGEYLIAHCPYYDVESSVRIEVYNIEELQHALNEFITDHELEGESEDSIAIFDLNEDVTVTKEGFKVSFKGY